MQKFGVMIAALLFSLTGAAYADDESTAKEHAEKAAEHDRAGDKARAEGKLGEAVKEYSERNKEVDEAVEKMMNPKGNKEDK